MGFLLGKSNAASLTEFEVTGQDVKFDNDKNKNRSINRSMQAYMYREKGNFIYEFDYLAEAKYRSMLGILQNRNSLREGMQLLPIPYSEDSTKAILDYNGITPVATTHGVYKVTSGIDPADMTLTDGNPPTMGSATIAEFTAGEYGNVGTYNASGVQHGPHCVDYTGFIFRFDLSNFISTWSGNELRRLTLFMHGMKSSPMRFFAYNWTQAAWYLIDDRYYFDDTQFSVPGFNLYKQLVAQLSTPWGDNDLNTDYLTGNKVYFMAVPGAGNKPALVQFVRLLANGYWVMADDPEDIEDFANAFTGAGRNGSLTFLEM